MPGNYINLARAPEMEITLNNLKALSNKEIGCYLLGFAAFLAVITAEYLISGVFRFIPLSRIYSNFLLS